jgi:hypothetical protein
MENLESISKNMLWKCEMCLKGKQLHLHKIKKIGEIFVIYMIILICACIYGIKFWGYMWRTMVDLHKGYFQDLLKVYCKPWK